MYYNLDSTAAGVQLRLNTMFMACGVLISMPYVSLLAYSADKAQYMREVGAG